MRIRIWRCAMCGRLSQSHCVRKPRPHVRYLSEWHPLVYTIPEDEVEWVENGLESETGAPMFSAKFRCGPYEEWRAEIVEVASP